MCVQKGEEIFSCRRAAAEFVFGLFSTKNKVPRGNLS